ncbi:MAG: sigma-70 family RNA polymerase sigma factor [Marinilabiliaceae bacterium]|jgi:RNA polymerase sigma-70 factor (ECF subfamily)|nr:sigma-70 family RNA polymerase sigma factor [Marinilabiliaceae bacterium]
MIEGSDIDTLLVERIIREGDRSSFDELYNKYSKRVYNFCLNFLGNEEDAKDCTQEIFIKAFCSIGTFRQKSTFYTWLYRIMINNCKDMYRKKGFRKVDLNMAGGIESDDRSAISRMITEKAIQAFHEALGKMSAEFRTVIILRDIEGRSYSEISAITGTGEGTVKSRIARARRRMAEKLKDYKDEL